MFQYSQQIGKKIKTIFVTTESIFKTNWDNFKEKLFFRPDEKSMKVVFDRILVFEIFVGNFKLALKL